MSPDLLVSIAGSAYARGLRFVYVGNVTSAFGELEHTRCPSCHATVIERKNYETTANHLRPDGACPSCARKIAGLYS
jgi:pyruvate formate lyase activating enzyme